VNHQMQQLFGFSLKATGFFAGINGHFLTPGYMH